MSSSSRLKILSLDGGGIKGLSSLVILKKIFHRMNAFHRKAKPPLPPIEPWEYFDLIGGTSTGGIIALMLGRLRMSISDCIDSYQRLGEDVFGDKSGWLNEHLFSAETLETKLRAVIKRVTGNEDEPMKDERPDCCKTVVYTLPFVNPNSSEPKALRTYPSDEAEDPGFTIWQAARATSAALTFFKEFQLPSNRSRWIDAALKFNNPGNSLLREVGTIFGNDYRRLDDIHRIGIFLSLGTGMAAIARIDDPGWVQRVSSQFRVPYKGLMTLKQIATDTEMQEDILRNRFPVERNNDPIYYRFNVQQGMEEVNLFDYEKIEEIQEYTDRYLGPLDDTVVSCVRCMMDIHFLSTPIQEGPQEVEARDLRNRLAALRSDSQAPSSTLEQCFHSLKYDVSLLVSTNNYWAHITVAGIQLYSNLWTEICSRGARSIDGMSDGQSLLSSDRNDNINLVIQFGAHFARHHVAVEKILEVWKRLQGGVSSHLMRNFALAAIYMIHVEGFGGRFRDQRPKSSYDGKLPISSVRLDNLKSFGNWVPCSCHQYIGINQDCGNEWNFANNNWGLHRNRSGRQACLVVVRSQEMQRKFATGAKQDSVLNVSEKKMAEQVVGDCFQRWAKDKDGFAVV